MLEMRRHEKKIREVVNVPRKREKIEAVCCAICIHRAVGHRGGPSIWSDCEQCSANPRFKNFFEPDPRFLSKTAKKRIYPRE